MPTVYKHNGQVDREVKNLGWLLRHAGDVVTISVYNAHVLADEASRLGVRDIPAHGPVWLLATLVDGREYLTRFLDAAVCRYWLRQRRLFRGMPLLWKGQRTTCDAKED